VTTHIPYILFLTDSGHAGYTTLRFQLCIFLLGLDIITNLPRRGSQPDRIDSAEQRTRSDRSKLSPWPPKANLSEIGSSPHNLHNLGEGAEDVRLRPASFQSCRATTRTLKTRMIPLLGAAAPPRVPALPTPMPRLTLPPRDLLRKRNRPLAPRKPGTPR
jgi:hypothetical protein